MSRWTKASLIGIGLVVLIGVMLLIWDQQGVVFWEEWHWPWTDLVFSEIGPPGDL